LIRCGQRSQQVTRLNDRARREPLGSCPSSHRGDNRHLHFANSHQRCPIQRIFPSDSFSRVPFREPRRITQNHRRSRSPGCAHYLLSSTTCIACFVAACSVTENPIARRSSPVSSASPSPSATGASAKCSESISPACRYWRTVETPPPILTSLSPAARFASRSASAIPPLTK